MPMDVPGDRYFQPAIETMPRHELTKLQTERILSLVPYAYERSAFYREVWDAAGVRPADIRDLDDFARQIPMITRDDIRAFRSRTGDPYAGLLCVEPSELTSITSSSGTTGEPEFFPELWDAQPPLPLASARDLWELGLRPGDRVLTPAGSFRGFFDSFYQMLGLVPVYADTWMGHWAEVLEVIKAYRPAYVQLMGPIIIELERLAATHDLREGFSCFKGASFAGQPLGRHQARVVREDWGLSCLSTQAPVTRAPPGSAASTTATTCGRTRSWPSTCRPTGTIPRPATRWANWSPRISMTWRRR
jgi:phenylacetate-CoA ligase